MTIMLLTIERWQVDLIVKWIDLRYDMINDTTQTSTKTDVLHHSSLFRQKSQASSVPDFGNCVSKNSKYRFANTQAELHARITRNLKF